MDQTDWFCILCLVVGFTHGLFLGWAMWRQPKLNYEELKNERTN